MIILGTHFFFAAVTPGSASHDDPVAPILIALVMMAFAAAIGGRVLRRFGQIAARRKLRRAQCQRERDRTENPRCQP